MKKNNLRQFMIKLWALTLAIIMAFPVNVFASSQITQNTSSYDDNASVMGDARKEDGLKDGQNTDNKESSLLKSELSQEETDHYIIEKSARLSKTTGQIDYKIILKSKAGFEEDIENIKASFATNTNTDLKDLNLEKVTSLDKENNELEVSYKESTPKGLFNTNTDITSLSINTEKSNLGLVYYLSAKIDQNLIDKIEEKSPILALDVVIKDNDNNPIYQNRYSLKAQTKDSEEITIDQTGQIVEDNLPQLIEDKSNSIVKGSYTQESKGLLSTSPATIKWSDYILSTDEKQFTYHFDLDKNQDTTNSKIKLQFYEATENGFELNKDFSQEVPYGKSLKLNIPQGQIAKIELTTTVKEDKNPQSFSYNEVNLKNPSYELNKENLNNQSKDQASLNKEDKKLANKNFFENSKSTYKSNNSITDKADQDFFENSVSAIELNKESLIANYKKRDELTTQKDEIINNIASSLERYNAEKINWEDFVSEIKEVTSTTGLEKAELESIVTSLTSGLKEESYKVAKIKLDDLTKDLYIDVNSKDDDKAKIDDLVAEKLKDPNLTLEDFQNYMYELEEKYDLTDEDADRIYGENADAIKDLIEKAREEKTTSDIFAVQDQSKFKKTYPYDIDYWTYQHYDQSNNTVNWDIQIETSQVNLDHLNFNELGLALYAPETQGLRDYKVTIRDYPGDEISRNSNSLLKLDSKAGSKTYVDSESFSGPENNLVTYNKKFSKGGENSTNLPDNLFIHVEATPKSDHAKYQMYDLGMRLTPDNNYINDVVKEFQNDWSKLVSRMPWILPFKSGDAVAEKFADGFNVVDTRLPADASVASYYDDQFKAKSYADKSRSVFGEFTTDKQIRWQVSDTLRLQDGDRFVLSGKLGDDIFSKAFNDNNKDGHNNPNIEVLEPNKDGTFKSIFATTAPNNPSSSADFRNKLGEVKKVLVPGTIINYTFTNRTVTDPRLESSLTIDFSNRFDDGVGTYGGKQTAIIRKLSDEEISSSYHVATQLAPIRMPGTRTNNQWYYSIPSNYDGNRKSWLDVNNRPNNQPINSQTWRIVENYDMVSCINSGFNNPMGTSFWDSNPIQIKRTLIKNPEELKKYLNKENINSANDIYEKLQRLYYYAEELKQSKALNDRELSGIYQVGILYITNHRIYDDGSVMGEYGTTEQDYKTYKEYLEDKVENNKLTEEQKSSVDIYIYYNDRFDSNKPGKTSYQNLVTGKVRRPVTFKKSFSESNNSLAEFKLKDSSGNIIKQWSTKDSNEEKLFLQAGNYTIEETSVNDGYGKLEPINFVVSEKQTVRLKNDIPLNKEVSFDNRNNTVASSNVGVTIRYPRTINEYPTKEYMVDNKPYNGNLSTDKYANSEYNNLPDPYNRYFEAVIHEKDRNLLDDPKNSLIGGNYIQKYHDIELVDNVNADQVSIDSDNLVINAVNKKDSGFKINKKLLGIDGEYYDLPGVEFILESKSSNTKNSIAKITNKEGIAVFNNLPLNSEWTLSENVPEGLKDKNKTWKIDVDANGKVTIDGEDIGDKLFEIINEPVTDTPPDPFQREEETSLVINKKDQDGKPLKGADFVLIDPRTGESITPTSKTDTSFTFTKLQYNVAYTLKEIKVPQGYTGSGDRIIIMKKDSSKPQISGEMGKEVKIDGTADGLSNASNKLSILTYDSSQNKYIEKSLDSNDYYALENFKDKKQQEIISLKSSFSLGDELRSGDYFVIKEDPKVTHGLNEEKGYNPPQILDASGNVLANGYYDLANKTITYVFTSNIDKLENREISLSINDYILNSNKVTKDGRVDLDFNIAGASEKKTLNAIYSPLKYSSYKNYMNHQSQVYSTNNISKIMRSVIYLNPDHTRENGMGPDKDTFLELTKIVPQGTNFNQTNSGIKVADSNIKVYRVPFDKKSEYMTPSIATLYKDGEDSTGLNKKAIDSALVDVTEKLDIIKDTNNDKVYINFPSGGASSRWGGYGYIVDVQSPFEGNNDRQTIYYNWQTRQNPYTKGNIPKSAPNEVRQVGELSIRTTNSKAEGEGDTKPTVPPEPYEIDVVNKKKSSNKFKIKKYYKLGEEEKAIEGAGFTLYAEDKKTIIKVQDNPSGEYFTNKDGEIYFWNLPNGTYWLKETTVPKGYETPTEDKLWTKIELNKDSENPTDPEDPDPEPEKSLLKSRIVNSSTQGNITSDGNHLADIKASISPVGSGDIVRDYDLTMTLTADELYDTVTSESKKYDTIDVLFLVENDSNIDSFNDYNANVGKILTKLQNRDNTARVGVISYSQGGIKEKLALTPANNVSQNDLQVSKDSTGGASSKIDEAAYSAKTTLQKSNAKKKIVVIVSSGKNIRNSNKANDINLKASVDDVYTYVKNSAAADNNYYNKTVDSGIRIASDYDHLIKGTAGWFDKVGENIDKSVSTTTTTKRVVKPAIDGQTLTLSPGQGFEITGDKEFTLPKLNKGETHTINTKVRLTGDQVNTYDVLSNVDISNGKVNIASPTVEIYNSKSALNIRSLIVPTSYAASIVKENNQDPYANIQISNQKPKDISFDDVVEYKIENIRLARFDIIKYDKSIGLFSSKLEDAQFTLYQDPEAQNKLSVDGVNNPVTTDKSGKASFESLPNGTYYLKESKAPSGYLPISTIWKIEVINSAVTITSDNDSDMFKITNQDGEKSNTKLEVANMKPSYPSTGGSGTWVGFAIIGTAVMLAGLAYYSMYQNNKNRRRSDI